VGVRVNCTGGNDGVVRALVVVSRLRSNEVILSMVLTESKNLSVGLVLDGSAEDFRFVCVLLSSFLDPTRSHMIQNTFITGILILVVTVVTAESRTVEGVR
jgi:hypothetical protein